MKTRPPSPAQANPKCKQAWPNPPPVASIGTFHVVSIGPGQIPHDQANILADLTPTISAAPPGAQIGLVWQNNFVDPATQIPNFQTSRLSLELPILRQFFGVALTYQGVTYGTLYSKGPP